ncbi:unnamed protein product [Brassica oleracea]
MFGSQLGFMYFKLCLQIGLFKLVLYQIWPVMALLI